MNTQDVTMGTSTSGCLSIRYVVVAASVALAMACTGAPPPPAAPPIEGPATFASPEQAVEAVVQASAANDLPALTAIFGPDGKDIVASGDSVQDRNHLADFVRLAREKTIVEMDTSDPHRATLSIGNDGWPFPVPIVETNEKWLWSPAEGRHEILLRRIGSNELDTIAVCLGYVEAQQDYAAMDPDKTGGYQYAQRIISTTGKRDGLYWPSEAGGPESPISEPIARALAEGYTKKTEPYHGYYYKVLMAQGPAAPFGEMNFVVRGRMIGGFALVAWPAQYRVTGVQTFIVSHAGIVLQRDLGPDTETVASAMTRFDPDTNWTVTENASEAGALEPASR